MRIKARLLISSVPARHRFLAHAVLVKVMDSKIVWWKGKEDAEPGDCILQNFISADI